MSAIVTELHPADIAFVAGWFASQEAPAPYAADDTVAGEALFNELGCRNCHANTPDGAPETPRLSAQHPGYLAKQMTDFRDGRRHSLTAPGVHPTVLGISDEEISAIATYLGAEERR